MPRKIITKFIDTKNEIGFIKAAELFALYITSRNKGYINYLINYFKKENFSTIEKYKKGITKNNKLKNNIIWFFWWQGENNLPEVSRICLNALRKNCPKEIKIIFIDKNNYQKYASIPKTIVEKVENKTISLTHFSDLLRQDLLCNVGGFWIDSTVFCPNPLDKNEIMTKEFWSIKIPRENISKKSYGQHISEGKFAGFILKNTNNSVIMNFVKDCNYNYWEKHDYLIEYFIQILLMRIAYENIPEAKKEIDDYNYSNEYLYKLHKILNEPYSEQTYEELISNTDYFKLSWKTRYNKTKNGKETYYGHICKEYIEKGK